MSSYDYNNRFTRRNWLGGEPVDLHVGNNNRPLLYRPSLFPTGTSFPTQIIFLNDGIVDSVNPSFRQFVQELHPTLTTGSQQWQRQPPPPTLTTGSQQWQRLPPPPSQEADSNLTEEEQQKALNKLEKKIYNPHPKNKTKKWCLYYRDNNTKNTKEENSDDEDKKGCAICLEDFVTSEEVLNTPCNHMFHEECIVPWVKSHGQCPICRAAFGERRQEVRLPALNNTSNTNNAANFTASDLMSLLRATYGIR